MASSSAPEVKNRVYVFGPFRLDGRNALLLLNGHPVSIPPRALAVLELLVEREGALVTKDDLIAEVWSGAYIEESNITKSIADVRRILRVGFRELDPIRTVWKQGYRFEVPVEVVRTEPVDLAPELAPELMGDSPIPAPVTAPKRNYRLRIGTICALLLAGVYFLLYAGGLPHPGSRRVGVLGIRNISGTTSTDWLGTALTETLTSELQAGGGQSTVAAEEVARMRGDLGFGANTSLNATDLHKAGLHLGCQLAVTGTFLESGGSLRLDLRVQDVDTGEVRASINETGTVADLFALVSKTGGDLRRLLGQPATMTPAAEPSVNAEALRLYAQGLERLRDWDATGAQDLLVRAAKGADDYAPIHAALAMDWSLMGFDQRARDEAKKAVQASAGLRREQQLLVEARAAELGADWPKAIETWRALWKFYPDQPEYAERVANALTSNGKARDAIDLLHNVHAADPRLQLAEAAAAFALSDFAGAIRASTGAEAAARQRSAQFLQSRALRGRGQAYVRQSEFEKARADFSEARRISTAIGDRGGVIEALSSEAELLRTKSSPGAEPMFREAVAMARELGSRRLTMRALGGLAFERRAHADMAGSRELLEQELAIAREIGDLGQESQALNMLGNIALNTGSPETARKLYADATARAREIGNRMDTAIPLGNLAILDLTSGSLAQAKAGFLDALKLKREIGDKSSTAYTLTYLGRTATTQGDLTEARRFLEESDALLKSVQIESIGPRIYLAELALAEGKPREAEASMMPLTVKLTKPAPGGQVWHIIARSWMMRGDVAKAREAADRCLALAAQTPNRADFGIPAGTVSAEVEVAEGQYAKARTHLSALLAEARKLNHVPNEMDIRLTMLYLEVRSGNARAALEAGRSLRHDALDRGFGLVASQAAQIGGVTVASGR